MISGEFSCYLGIGLVLAAINGIDYVIDIFAAFGVLVIAAVASLYAYIQYKRGDKW